MPFSVPSPCSFPKLQLKGVKKFEILFAVFNGISSKILSHILKILIQTGEINILVLHSLVYVACFQIKGSFPSKINTHGEI